MFDVGLEIHDKRKAVWILSEAGQVARRAQVPTIDEMMGILEALPERFDVSYKGSCGCGHYHDLLSPIAAPVTVAHPGRLRLIVRSKDKKDRKHAERLAKLLYLGEAPAVHVPLAEVRTWGSGTQVASRGPSWRIATPRYCMGATVSTLMALRHGG
jgi:hypothetical protein